MSEEYCKFFPDDPQCVKAPEPQPEQPDEGAGGDEPEVECEGEDCPAVDEMEEAEIEMAEEEEWYLLEGLRPVERKMMIGYAMQATSMSPIMGHIGFQGVASAVLVRLCINMFRYYNVTDYYKQFLSKTGATNWFEIADMIKNYGGLAIWGLAWIFNLLAMLGILVEINWYVWAYGVGALGSLLMVVDWIFTILAVDAAYTEKNTAAQGAIKSRSTIDMAWEVLFGGILLESYWNWEAAQWEALDEETQATMIEELVKAAEEYEKEMAAEEPEMEEAMEEGEEELEEGEEGADEEEAEQ